MMIAGSTRPARSAGTPARGHADRCHHQRHADEREGVVRLDAEEQPLE
ncbi:MAG TPA: hypothetical protein VMN78_03450 [Longimicrobiales bacterium]|nr:hypothetical protein [Longimicrobiales bacterium]